MKRWIKGQPLNLWNAGDLLDHLDECIHTSQITASELIYAADNADNKVDNVFTTPEFDSGLRSLVSKHKTTELKKLKEIIKSLLYEGAVTTQYHNHTLSNKSGGNPHGLQELHISGDLLLHYRYWADNTLIVSLSLVDVTNHKQQKSKVSNKQRYQEESRRFISDQYSSDVDLVEDIVDINTKKPKN